MGKYDTCVCGTKQANAKCTCYDIAHRSLRIYSFIQVNGAVENRRKFGRDYIQLSATLYALCFEATVYRIGPAIPVSDCCWLAKKNW